MAEVTVPVRLDLSSLRKQIQELIQACAEFDRALEQIEQASGQNSEEST